MNFKLLLLPVMALAPAMSFADEYYVTPEGAGSKDGSSWENAFDIDAFRTKAANNKTGDEYNLAGGTYVLSSRIDFKAGTGVILRGSVVDGRTVLSGDLDGNGNAGAGDASCLVAVHANTAHAAQTAPVVIDNIDFTCVYTNAEVTSSKTSAVGALYIDNSGSVEVTDCSFYKTWSNKNAGGAALFVYRSTALFKNCVFKNNKAAYRGGAVRLSSEVGTAKRVKEFVTFDGCQFTNNLVHGKNGGAIYMECGSQLNIINSTIAENTVTTGGGAAIYINENFTDDYLANTLNIVGSTIANNTDLSGEGAQVVFGKSGKLNIVNSIVVGSDEKTVDLSFTAEDGNAFDVVSGGWNYVGSVVGAPADVEWLESDSQSDRNVSSRIFGDNALEDGVIRPAHYVLEGATGTQTQAAVADWGIYHSVDYAVDQLGDNRGADMTNGAVAVKKINTGVDDVIANGAEVRLVKIADGVYRIAGANCVEAYNIMGSRVAVASGDVISLESAANGLYIIKAGNKSFKVIK